MTTFLRSFTEKRSKEMGPELEEEVKSKEWVCFQTRGMTLCGLLRMIECRGGIQGAADSKNCETVTCSGRKGCEQVTQRADVCRAVTVGKHRGHRAGRW